MGRGLVLGGKQARALERDVDAEILPRQLRGIALGGDLDRPVADADGIALHSDIVGETAMHAVVAQQVGIGFDRAQIVEGNDFDVLAIGFRDGAQNVATDPAKSVNGNAYCHNIVSRLLSPLLRPQKRIFNTPHIVHWSLDRPPPRAPTLNRYFPACELRSPRSLRR